MNIAILVVSSLNLAITVTAILIAKQNVEEAKAEVQLMRDKVNGVTRSLSRFEL